MNKVDQYIEKHQSWSEGLEILRKSILETELEETVKWGAPTYTINGKNVVGLGAFKNHFGLWFFQGVFLKDKHQLLVNAQEGKTKALRQMRFTSVAEINVDIIKQYVKEAIDNQKAGKEVKIERNKTFEIPELLQNALDKDKEFNSAFTQLSPGKQKEYANYILEAKREETRLKRLEKITPMVNSGIGLYDKYKNC